MAGDERTQVEDPTPAGEADSAAGDPSWWHRDHPTFTALAGFFTGLLVIIVVPLTFGALLSVVVADETVAEVFPFVLLVFAVPLVLLAMPRTRRFGRYLLVGMVTTGLVVVGMAALTLWVLIQLDG